jgi:hypothetical protein
MDHLPSTIISVLVGLFATIYGNVYFGAVVIAVMASTTRVAFECDCAASNSCLRMWARYFFMSVGLCMLFVHIGAIAAWNTDTTIVVAGGFACFAEETLVVLRSSWASMAKAFIKGAMRGKD